MEEKGTVNKKMYYLYEMCFIVEVVIACLVVSIVTWVIWRKRKLSMFKRFGIPGPQPSFWTGNLGILDPNKNLEIDLIDKYGKIVGLYLGSKPFMLVADPELLKLIQVKEFKNFVNKDLLFRDMGIPLKCMTTSIEVTKDDFWRNLRYTINPAFSTGKIKNMLTIINDAVNIFVKKSEESGEEPIDVMDMCRRLSFDVISRTSFEISSNIQNNEKNTFTESLEHIFQFGTSNLDSLTICFPEFEPILTPTRWIIDYVRCFLNLPSAGLIKKICLKLIESKKNSVQNQPVNILQMLLHANQNFDSKDESDVSETKSKSVYLSDDTIVANTLTFMVGGYETVGSALGYALYLLAEHPTVQEKVRDEINSQLNEKDTIDYSVLANLQYLDQVLAEVTRLFPVYFPGVNRVCTEEFKYNDITVPKNTVVTAPLWHLHSNPDYWTSPEKFMPERFSAENRSKIDQFVYQPFGAGPRSCIGMRLSQMIMKSAIVHLLKGNRIEKSDESQKLQLSFELVFVRPAKNLFIRVTPL